MSFTLNTADNTVTVKDANTSMTDKLVNAIKMPFAEDNVLFNSDEAMYCALVWGVAGHASGSIIGRKRQAEGKEPILKFFA